MTPIYKFEAYFLIVLYYMKFLFQIILKYDGVFLDIILYILLIAMLVGKNNRDLIVVWIFAAISIITPTARNIFLILLTTYLLGRIPLKNIVRMNIIMGLLVFSIMYALLKSGFVVSSQFLENIHDDRDRWDWGYGNPNRFALFTYSIIINVYILIKSKTSILFWGATLAVALFVFHVTKARSFVLSLSLLFMMSVFCSIFKSFSVKHRNLFMIIPFILFVIVVVFSILVDDFPILDLLFNHRLSQYNILVTNSSPFQYLIGNQLINDDEVTIDSSYIHLIFEAGILAVFIFLYLYFKTIKNLTEEDLYFIPLSCSLLAYGISESLLVFILNFGCMIYWSMLYYGYRKSLNNVPELGNNYI